MNALALLRRIHAKMVGVSETEVQAALSEKTVTAGSPSFTFPQAQTWTW